jgi:subtilisin family serine protease
VAQQDGVLGYILSVDPTVQVLGRLKFALNALLLDVDAAALPQIAANPEVIAVNPVVDYALDLSETVPYIGATAPNVVSQGQSGQGIKVAVLDSGIDYTHAEFGGPGTAAAYEAAYGTSMPTRATRPSTDCSRPPAWWAGTTSSAKCGLAPACPAAAHLILTQTRLTAVPRRSRLRARAATGRMWPTSSGALGVVQS